MLEPWQLLSLPAVTDSRGTLIPIDLGSALNVPPERIFILDIQPGQSRGDHACKEGTQLIIPIKGTISVSLHNGSLWRHFDLDKSTSVLKVSPWVWRRITAGTEGSIVLVIDSSPFDEKNFIREFPQFLALNQANRPNIDNAK